MDFMSYTMLSLANGSKEALLDPKTYMQLASQTFGVFLKHFISDNVTSTAGGNAYQPIGERLPWTLGKHQEVEMPRNVTATIHIPVEQLVMSPTAVFLCISLLMFLVVVTIVAYTANHKHYKRIPRGVDTLVSTITFVHASENLLLWAQDAPEPKSWYRAIFSKRARAKENQMMASMGPFTGADGTEGWGIELINPLVSAHAKDSSSKGECIELRTREQPPVLEVGDIGMHEGLIGHFEWEASSLTIASTETEGLPAEDRER